MSRKTILVFGSTGAQGGSVARALLARGKFNVRIERTGRPEVKNMMLAPKQFDVVNRDLEIRDLYNMEDAFHLGPSYHAAYRARMNANLAFWDGAREITVRVSDEAGPVKVIRYRLLGPFGPASVGDEASIRDSAHTGDAP